MNLASRMSERLKHRGPDDGDIFIDQAAGVALGHRRLSVIDLSVQGHQPMRSKSGRYIIVFNGEIYNHPQLRNELELSGSAFIGHSDTEVMLAVIERYGLEDSLQRFNGMFAFALWDRQERELTLVRDRLGIKPLYYGWVGKRLAFASELKALTVLPGFHSPVNRDSLGLLMRHGYIPAPHSIYRDIYKLMPGTVLRLDREFASRSRDLAQLHKCSSAYWSARNIAQTGEQQRFTWTDAEAVDALDHLLRDAVALRMEADVPLGAFLSGGVDSSTVVALMQAQSTQPVKTFSIGFHEPSFNEACHARKVAEHLGTDHHELYVSAQDALDVVPLLPTLFDEPFADSSQIPTFLLSKLTRNSVTVSLSGDGGDELFGGYSRYLEAERLRRWVQFVPGPLRNGAARVLDTQNGLAPRIFQHACGMLPARLRPRSPLTAARTLAGILSARSDVEHYARMVSHWQNVSDIVTDFREAGTAFSDPRRQARLGDRVERMMYTDLVSYLPDDCLTKVDRASMATSLEARVPLLDHRVVAFAWRTPPLQKIRDGQGKWLLRQVLYRYVPRALIDRPKMGFGVPIGDWLRGPLRDWAESLLDEQRLRSEGYFFAPAVRNVWTSHLNGSANEPYQLWNVLMFQAWLEQSKSPV